MEAFPAHCASQSKTHGRVRPASGLLALALLVSVSASAAQEETAAVLKAREVDFYYRSSTVRFPCHELQSNVATIMRALGAREDVDVRATNCDSFLEPDEGFVDQDEWRTPSDRGHMSGPWQTSSDRFAGTRSRAREQSVHVRMRVMMPVKVTPEILDEMNKDKSRRDLVARVTGNMSTALNDPIVFPAQIQRVTLSHRTIKLQPEHCELLQQMSRTAFRKLDLRVVGGGPRCDRDRISHIPPEVTVEALMPIMPTAPQVTPAAEGESEPADPTSSETQQPEPATQPD